jgi:hypothetical protein
LVVVIVHGGIGGVGGVGDAWSRLVIGGDWW